MSDRQTDTQTRGTTILFMTSTTHAKYNKQGGRCHRTGEECASSRRYDGMGLVQKLNRSNKTFGQVAELAFTDILHEGDKVRELILSLMYIAPPPSNMLNDNSLQHKNLAVQQWRNSVWIFEQDIPDQVVDRGVNVQREVNGQGALCHLRTKLFRASSKVGGDI